MPIWQWQSTVPLMEAKRDVELDVLRGIGIILVVYGHFARGLVDLGLAHHPATLKTLDFILYTTHMPLFFLIAGLNARASQVGRSRCLVKRHVDRFGLSMMMLHDSRYDRRSSQSGKLEQQLSLSILTSFGPRLSPSCVHD